MEKMNVLKEIKSHQTNEDGSPVINLIDGDIVELKDDGIYLTRKINISTDSKEVLENIFKALNEQNKIF